MCVRATYLRQWVFLEACIQDSIGDLISTSHEGVSQTGNREVDCGITDAILSGCPSPTDSEVKRNDPCLWA